MGNVRSEFRKLLLKALDVEDLNRYWYLWLPWTNMLFTLIATIIVGKIPFGKLLEIKNCRQLLVLILLLFLSIVKSYLISRYSATIDNDNRIKSLIYTFVYHLLPSFFLIWVFYFNWNSWKIIFLLLLDFSVSLSSNWLMKRKVHAHIIADIVSLAFFVISFLLKFDIENKAVEFFIAILFVTFRYLLITSFYKGIHIKRMFSQKQDSDKFYWFSELISSGIFLTTLSAILEELSNEISLATVLPSLFIYYIFLYLRLFLYKQYGVSYKELYYFVVLGGGILLYIWIINWINLSIVIWFFPAVIVILLDDFVYLNYRRYTNQSVELSIQGKQLFSKLKLYLLVSLFLYNIISENEEQILTYNIFGFSLDKVENVIFRDYFLLPLLALGSAGFISICIFKIIASLLKSNPYLISETRVVKSMRYRSSRRLHKRK